MLNTETVRGRLPRELKSSRNLEDIIEEVVADFENRTGILWNYRENYVETYPSRGDEQVIYLPIKFVTSISIRERSKYEDDWTSLDDSDFSLIGDRSVVKHSSTFSDFIEVTMSGGYTSSNIPSDIRMALITQVAFVLSRDSNIDLNSQNFEGGAGVFMHADCHPRYKSCVSKNLRRV